jgi:hypothetical protein
MRSPAEDEWGVITALLPIEWKQAARDNKAFQRARYTPDPDPLLRLLLFHAINDAGLRETVAQARVSGIAEMSQVALLKRIRTSGAWLAWLGAGLCQGLREAPRLPNGLRPRAIDSTTVQGPASKGTEWRVHYSLDLVSLQCDWFELTDAHGAELLERTPARAGDVLIGDRNYLRPAGVQAIKRAEANVLVRLRWTHSRMIDKNCRAFHALRHARRLKVGQVGAWDVDLLNPGEDAIPGRVIATKLPAPVAAQAERRADRRATKKGTRPDPRSLEAAHFVMVFTTLPDALLSAVDVLELYRFRWQIELAFKRLKQLLRLGRLPHKDPATARSWILAKLVVALIIEKLLRNAQALSPWGYSFQALPPITAGA